MEKIRVRIAPSPTGLFHLGTARTALFNYLFAKNQKGTFILRFEDTDKTRSKKEFEQDIITGLKWLGLEWDQEIVYQKDRLKTYQERTDELVKNGFAYKKDGAIWFKMPENKIVGWNDLIRGRIEFHSHNDKDFVIVRSDNTPLFALSNVVDDFEIDKITHIIRGEDHISNTPRQILIAQALGYSVDTVKYAHLPMILNKDRSKMSKRKDPVSITKDFKDQGYLSAAMVNFMALLGWSPGNDREVLDISEIIKLFKLQDVGKSPAVFEMEKLDWLNGYYIRQIDLDDLFEQTKKYLPKNIDIDFAKKFLQTIRERMRTLNQAREFSQFYFNITDYKKELLVFKNSNIELTQKGLEKSLKALSDAPDDAWQSITDLNQLLADVVKENRLSNGDVFWPIRAALSGLEQSPSPTEILWVLGKEESLKRVSQAITKLNNNSA